MTTMASISNYVHANFVDSYQIPHFRMETTGKKWLIQENISSFSVYVTTTDAVNGGIAHKPLSAR